MSSVEIRQLYSKWKNKGSERHKEKLFKLIWEEYHPKLQVYLNQMGLWGDEVVDLVSELLLYVFENLNKYNDSYAFSTWIYTVVRNRMIDRGRKKQIYLDEWEDHLSISERTPEEETIREMERLQIHEAINKLKELDRELVYLHFFEDLKYREISQVTGVPEGTVKYRMSEIRKTMKSEIEGTMAYGKV